MTISPTCFLSYPRYALTLGKIVEQYNSAAGKLKRIAVHVALVQIDLPKSSDSFFDRTTVPACDCLRKRKLRPRKEAYRHSGTPSSAKPRVNELSKRVDKSLSPTLAGREATKSKLKSHM